MLICYITDRGSLGGDPETHLGRLDEFIRQAIEAGVDFVQIREKDLPTRDLLPLVERAVGVARRQAGEAPGASILVNDRLDVALAAGAFGVHLGGQSIPAGAVRQVVPKQFVIGVSCHSLEDALKAESAGADYLLFGPIFDTPSKRQYGPPLGLPKLSEVASRARIPVLALGGITVNRALSCQEAGAAGIAGISLFQSAESVVEVIRHLRELK